MTKQWSHGFSHSCRSIIGARVVASPAKLCHIIDSSHPPSPRAGTTYLLVCLAYPDIIQLGSPTWQSWYCSVNGCRCVAKR